MEIITFFLLVCSGYLVAGGIVNSVAHQGSPETQIFFITFGIAFFGVAIFMGVEEIADNIVSRIVKQLKSPQADPPTKS